MPTGVNPRDLRGKNIGVYTGSTVGDNDFYIIEDVANGHGLTGHSRNMLPNRISYWLDVKGKNAT